MAPRIAINGFGRIGRLVLRAAARDTALELVAVNDVTDATTIAHLLKYDSTYGPFPGEVALRGDVLVAGPAELRVSAIREPAALPWRELGVDVVLESSGRFTERSAAAQHLEAGAKKVVVSAPGKNVDRTIVLGVNEAHYDPQAHHIVSMGSCTTNCLAPIAKVLHEELQIVHGLMTTTHAFTNDQVVLDYPHRDLRRARSASQSLIPTSTGAARAIAQVIPELEGKLDGMSIRVPTPTVSLVDLVARVKRTITAPALNDLFRARAAGPLRGILAVSDEPLVSADYRGSDYSATIDALSTKVMGGELVKILAWYDNEWAFARRMAEFLAFVSS